MKPPGWWRGPGLAGTSPSSPDSARAAAAW